MKKSDLKSGMIIETRDERKWEFRCFKTFGIDQRGLIGLRTAGLPVGIFIDIRFYDEDLMHKRLINSTIEKVQDDSMLDIIKVYNSEQTKVLYERK